MCKDISNKTPYFAPLVILCLVVFSFSSIYACIGQYGQIPPVLSYPSDPTKIPQDIDMVGENTLVILIDFENCAGTMPQDSWNKILLTTNTPGKSMRDYYLEVSNSNVSLVGAQENSGISNNGVVGWYRMPFNHPYTTYGSDWASTTGESLPGMPLMNPSCRTWALSRQLAYLACKKADSNVNYAQFNHEHQGSGSPPVLGWVYAHIIIIVAGYEGSFYGAPGPYTWRHHWYMPGDGYVSNDQCSCFPYYAYMCVGGSVLGYGYSLIGEKTPTGNLIGQGLISHELGHDFGLPDLYDTDTINGYGDGVGEWCLMAGGDWLGTPYATKPAHFSAWCKIDRGWVLPTVVQNTKLTNIQIPAIESVPVIYKLIPYNLPNCRQYFLVENRQLKKFDAAIKGTGLLIYHCDDSMIGLYRSSNKINSRVGYTNNYHYGVDVECQDGFPANETNRDDLDTVYPYNRGDAGDPWDGSPDFDTNSTPNSSVYYSSKSYVAVKNISMNNGIITATIWTLPPGVTFAASPSSINFGSVNVGSFKTDSTIISNNGTSTLSISSVVSDNLEFDVTPTSADIEPDSSKKFYITFNPSSAGSKTGNIEFTHNASSSPDTVMVSGTGIASGVSGWAQKESMPHPPDLKSNKNVKDGGALTSERGRIYAFPGNKSWQFYKYTQGTPGFWTQLESIPYGYKPGVVPPTINKKKVSKGGALCAEDNRIYATKGNGTKEFWAYLIDEEGSLPADTWISLAPVPSVKGLKGGTSILHWGRQQIHKIYLLAGGQKPANKNFFVYDISTETWDSLPSIPLTPDNKAFKDGSCIALADKKIWALKGGGKHNYFYCYDSTLATWTQKETIPLSHPNINKKKKVKAGGAMTVCDDLMYAIKGGGSNEFWAYNYEDSTWYPKDTIPRLHKKSIPKAGAALTELDDKVWLLKGNDTRECWCYTPEAKSEVKSQKSKVTDVGQGFSPASSQANLKVCPTFSVSPNPFSKLTTIRYNVPLAGNVSIKLYNSSGRLIKTLVNDHLNVGSYSLVIDNGKSKIPAGIYFLRFESKNNHVDAKLIIQ